MATAKERLGQMQASAAKAVETVEGDAGASPVLLAVVRELANKVEKVQGVDGEGALREAVVEVEQAADSAKAAVEADPAASERSKAVVLAAHDLICVTKTKMNER